MPSGTSRDYPARQLRGCRNLSGEPDFWAAFRTAILENALVSREEEAGCHVFDVCESEDRSEIFLYEVYADETAFKDHLATEHFRRFDALAALWVNEKQVTVYSQSA